MHGHRDEEFKQLNGGALDAKGCRWRLLGVADRGKYFPPAPHLYVVVR